MHLVLLPIYLAALLDTMNCRTLFRQSITYYQNNVINANLTYLTSEFPDIGEKLVKWHNKFKKDGAAKCAERILEHYVFSSGHITCYI